MKIKTSVLTGIALDWAVTTIEAPDALKYGVQDWREQRRGVVKNGEYLFRWHQSWAQGGPIIKREGIWLRGPHDACKPDGTVVLRIDYWYAHKNHTYVQNDLDPLIAAMRCHVAANRGDEVEVPDDLD